MGYNYSEAFRAEEEVEKEQQAFEESLSEEEMGEYVFYKMRLDQIRIRLEEILKDVDIEVAHIIKTCVNYQFTIQNKNQIDASMKELREIAEGLINSKDANTPEILAQRKEIAEKINDLLIVDERVSQRLKELQTESVANKFYPPEKHMQAHQLISPIIEDIKKLKEPINFELN